MSLNDEWCLVLGTFLSLLFVHTLCNKLRLELLHLLTIVLVESHIVVADEVVTLLSARLRSLSIAPLLPSEHGLTDMYSTVVHYIGLHHTVAVNFHDLCERPSQEVVAHVSQMERLIGVW